MFIESPSPTLLLSAGEVLRLPAAACATVECAGGSVWITQDGWNEDVILEPGESFDSRRDGLVLIQAFEPSLLRLRPAECAQAGRGSRSLVRRAAEAVASRLAAAARIGAPGGGGVRA